MSSASRVIKAASGSETEMLMPSSTRNDFVAGRSPIVTSPDAISFAATARDMPARAPMNASRRAPASVAETRNSRVGALMDLCAPLVAERSDQEENRSDHDRRV